MPFTKLDSDITKSSIWSEPLHVRVVWVSFLAEKDENGFVSGSRSGMIRVCNVNPDEFDSAVKILESPDKESRTPDFEGRRIAKIEGGWIVLNHDKYRLPEDEKKKNRNEYMKKYMREKRKDNCVSVNEELTPVNSGLTSVSVSVSESSLKKEGCGEKTKPQWMTDFDIYFEWAKSEGEKLTADEEWMNQRSEFHPNLDIFLSMKKAFRDYWGTKAGWAKKKDGCRLKRNGVRPEVDWKATYTNALTMKSNQVWKQFGKET